VAPGIYEWPASVFRYYGSSTFCYCGDQVNLFRHYLLAHIPEEYMRLEQYDYYGDPDAWDATTEYIDNWENFKHHGMGIGYYSHKLGTGKTFLSTRVARELVKLGETVFYINFRDIVGLFEVPYEERKEEEDRLRHNTLLVLDEVVPSISTAQHALFAEKLEEIIRYRTNYNRVTILTTNMKPEELDKEYPRTYSLLSAKEKHIEVKGSDARREIWDINERLVADGERRPVS
jgi:DNA replication protein DnaC